MGSKTDCFTFGSINFNTANYPDIFMILCTKQKKYDQRQLNIKLENTHNDDCDDDLIQMKMGSSKLSKLHFHQ